MQSQQQCQLDTMQQQLRNAESILAEQHVSNLADVEEEHRLQLAQLATFLAWEKDDKVVELNTAHEEEVCSLVMQHEQQLDAVQAQMTENSLQSLQAMNASNTSAAEAMVAQHAQVCVDLTKLHEGMLAYGRVGTDVALQQMSADHAESIKRLQSEHESQVTETVRAYEQALADALAASAQSSALETQCCLSDHAAELESVRLEHQKD